MNTPDPLDELLSEWRVTAESESSLPREVWLRIAAEEVEPSWFEQLASMILQPRWLTRSSGGPRREGACLRSAECHLGIA